MFKKAANNSIVNFKSALNAKHQAFLKSFEGSDD
jgi:hypothetical protein